MWNRDLKVFTLVYVYSRKERHVDANDDFSHWGQRIREQKTVTLVAPSEFYVRAWLSHNYDYAKEAAPEVISITSTELTALINPNHP